MLADGGVRRVPRGVQQRPRRWRRPTTRRRGTPRSRPTSARAALPWLRWGDGADAAHGAAGLGGRARRRGARAPRERRRLGPARRRLRPRQRRDRRPRRHPRASALRTRLDGRPRSPRASTAASGSSRPTRCSSTRRRASGRVSGRTPRPATGSTDPIRAAPPPVRTRRPRTGRAGPCPGRCGVTPQPTQPDADRPPPAPPASSTVAIGGPDGRAARHRVARRQVERPAGAPSSPHAEPPRSNASPRICSASSRLQTRHPTPSAAAPGRPGARWSAAIARAFRGPHPAHAPSKGRCGYAGDVRAGRTASGATYPAATFACW